MQMASLGSKFGIKASQQSRIPMHITRFLFCVCACVCASTSCPHFQRRHLCNAHAPRVRTAADSTGEEEVVDNVNTLTSTFTHYPRWKSPGTKYAAEIPIPCKSRVAAASRGVPRCRRSHRRFPRKALASFRWSRVTICVFAVGVSHQELPFAKLQSFALTGELYSGSLPRPRLLLSGATVMKIIFT